MLPTLGPPPTGYRTAQVLRLGTLQLYFTLHDDCPMCRDMVAFSIDGQDPVVCDTAGKKGGVVQTGKHRADLEPDKTKWLSAAEFYKRWTKAVKTEPPLLPTICHSGSGMVRVIRVGAGAALLPRAAKGNRRVPGGRRGSGGPGHDRVEVGITAASSDYKRNSKRCRAEGPGRAKAGGTAEAGTEGDWR